MLFLLFQNPCLFFAHSLPFSFFIFLLFNPRTGREELVGCFKGKRGFPKRNLRGAAQLYYVLMLILRFRFRFWLIDNLNLRLIDFLILPCSEFELMRRFQVLLISQFWIFLLNDVCVLCQMSVSHMYSNPLRHCKLCSYTFHGVCLGG